MAAKLAGSWVPPHVALSTGLLECPHHVVAGFPRARDLRHKEEAASTIVTQP